MVEKPRVERLEIVGANFDRLGMLHRGDVETTDFRLKNTGETTVHYEHYVCSVNEGVSVDPVGEVKHALIAGATSAPHEFKVTVAHDSPLHAGSFFIVTDDQDKDRNRVCAGV